MSSGRRTRAEAAARARSSLAAFRLGPQHRGADDPQTLLVGQVARREGPDHVLVADEEDVTRCDPARGGAARHHLHQSGPDAKQAEVADREDADRSTAREDVRRLGQEGQDESPENCDAPEAEGSFGVTLVRQVADDGVIVPHDPGNDEQRRRHRPEDEIVDGAETMIEDTSHQACGRQDRGPVEPRRHDQEGDPHHDRVSLAASRRQTEETADATLPECGSVERGAGRHW